MTAADCIGQATPALYHFWTFVCVLVAWALLSIPVAHRLHRLDAPPKRGA